MILDSVGPFVKKKHCLRYKKNISSSSDQKKTVVRTLSTQQFILFKAKLWAGNMILAYSPVPSGYSQVIVLVIDRKKRFT